MFTGIALTWEFQLTVFVTAAVISAGLVLGSWLMHKVLSLLGRPTTPPSK